MSFPVGVRNNLDIPVRITIFAHNKSSGGSGPQILITVGEEGVTLKSYYGICIDSDVHPNEEWEDVGVLEVLNEPRIKVVGKE